ncbi:hypothetical protein ACEPAG_3055 [Sanghuangporus baumii]
MSRNFSESDVVAFLDIAAQVSNDTDEESGGSSEEDNAFIDDVQNVPAQHTSHRPVQVDAVPADDAEEAETIAREIVERARKRRRTEPQTDVALERAQDGLAAQMKTGRALFADGMHIDDSAYEMYCVRATDARRETELIREHFPPHCLAFHIPWLAGRVYLWVPNVQPINDMFAARGRAQTARHPARIPVEEQGLVFAMLQNSQPPYHAGSWIKVTKGKFAGDFGIVEKVSRDGRIVFLALMARVHHSPEQSTAARPDKRLATLTWLRETFRSEPITHFDDGTYEFRRGRYRDGLRLLCLTTAGVQPAFPSLHEVQPFRLQHLGDLQDVESYVQVGDLVAIHSGSLKNLVGAVQERMDSSVTVGQLKQIDSLDAIIDNEWFSRPANDERTYWDYLRQLRRTDVLLELEEEVEDEKLKGAVSTHVRNVRRFLDVGDEVLVRVGLHSGKQGVIVQQDGDMLKVMIKDSEIPVEVSRFWVETVSKDPMHVTPTRKENASHLFNNGVVCICIGEYAGRWGKVLEVASRTNIFVLIRGDNGYNDVVEEYSADQLVEWTPDMIEDFKLPLMTKDEVYAKTHRNRFVGKYVFIWNRGDSGRGTRLAKGMHGFVTDVDEERKTARVSYQNREESFPLRNLVSVDFLCSLDRKAPLSPPEFSYLFRQVQELQAKRGTSVQTLAANLQPLERTDKEKLVEYKPVPMKYEPVTGRCTIDKKKAIVYRQTP